jgi:SPP1 family predicted phage head-tail adaptor
MSIVGISFPEINEFLEDSIAIQSQVETDDGSGGDTTSWVTDSIVDGKVSPLNGKELYEMQNINPEINSKIFLKKGSLITNKNRAVKLLSDTGLLAAYDMMSDNNSVLMDISGNENDGTVSGARQKIESMLFDGVDDYVQINQIDSIAGTGNLTLAAFVKSDTDSGTTYVIAQAYNGNGVSLYINNNYPNMSINNQATPGLNQIDGGWHTVVGTYDNSLDSDNMKIYVDGVLQSSIDYTDAMEVTSNDVFYLAARGDSTARIEYMGGELSDARIYSITWTAEQVAAYHT